MIMCINFEYQDQAMYVLDSVQLTRADDMEYDDVGQYNI